ncbi:HEAT repeat domain-containing protein [Halosimplex rubrum]|uniref:HEAT repeat domain-containing protein n=1 Tax=Halosimplex rubrum TaxID=869889 RepID=A0A7D5P2V1_9EURY|nr:HEAT repeat domain-containing protein [Halosimplex rubrum]QLH77701.1 HEAT repeat domain-containing protein [Halosimplex rubrum]
MSNGDDEAADEEAANEEADAGEAEETALSADTLDQRLDDAEEALDGAETEADLDEVEEDLNEIEADLDAADLPEPDEDDEDAEDPAAELEDRITDLRDQLEDQRGPYAEDVVTTLEAAQSTITDTRWTEDGRPDVVAAVDSYLKTVESEIDTAISAESGDSEDLADAVDQVAQVIEGSALDPDEDEETIAALLEAAETLQDDLEAAEEWDDLTVRQQLDAEGFYDVLESENRKDFPAEWNAVKVYEELGEVEPIVKALETFDSDFMEENVLDTLWRMGPEEAYDAVEQRAQKRNVRPVQILGKIGNADATETLHDFIDGDGDAALQKVTLRALGEIGSEESVQPVAQRLDADNYEIRSAAARSLGLLGDTRAIEPLADVLEDDEANEVRASAAWALNQIGTQRALDVVAEYADDRAYLVQSEAEKAV